MHLSSEKPNLVMFPKKEGANEPHPTAPPAIHPVPPPYGCGKGGINFD